MLVLDHDPSKFTRGIILNRPSSKVLVDEDEKGNIVQWKVWFGGDVQGTAHFFLIKSSFDVYMTILTEI